MSSYVSIIIIIIILLFIMYASHKTCGKLASEIPDEALDCIVTMSSTPDLPHVNTSPMVFLIRYQILITWRPGTRITNVNRTLLSLISHHRWQTADNVNQYTL